MEADAARNAESIIQAAAAVTICCVHRDRRLIYSKLLLKLTAADVEMRISARRYCKSQYTGWAKKK